MRGEGGGAGQRLFGIFPKIHSFLGHHPSLTFDIVPASPEARAECEAFCLNWYSMYFGMNVPNPINANTKKMVDPKLAMNNLLPRSLLRAGKNASFVLALSPFNSYSKGNKKVKKNIKKDVSTSASLLSLLASESVFGNL